MNKKAIAAGIAGGMLLTGATSADAGSLGIGAEGYGFGFGTFDNAEGTAESGKFAFFGLDRGEPQDGFGGVALAFDGKVVVGRAELAHVGQDVSGNSDLHMVGDARVIQFGFAGNESGVEFEFTALDAASGENDAIDFRIHTDQELNGDSTDITGTVKVTITDEGTPRRTDSAD